MYSAPAVGDEDATYCTTQYSLKTFFKNKMLKGLICTLGVYQVEVDFFCGLRSIESYILAKQRTLTRDDSKTKEGNPQNVSVGG